MNADRPSIIGILVPALTGGGGVPAVAEYLCRVIEGHDRYVVRLFNLPTDSNDEGGVRLRRPRTWFRGMKALGGRWRGRDFTQVGACLCELEFQRYRPRRGLDDELRRCDLIQVVAGTPAAALAARRSGKPIVLQVATLAAVERRQWQRERHSVADVWRRAMTRVVATMDKMALRNVAAVMVENPWMLEHCRQVAGTRGVAVHYAPPGIDTDYFAPDPTARPATAASVLCVGRLDDPRKNIALLIRAFARLVADGDSATRLVLAGASAPDAAAMALISSSGLTARVDIEVRPDTARLRDLYRSASCFALPSDEEGLGLVILESMACGVPAIATRCGGPEGIITNGIDGLLVERDDEVALFAGLKQLLANRGRRERMGVAARLTAVERYSLEVTGAAYIALYDRLLGRRETAREASR